MNKYNSYKDSEVKWLDKIPDNWERSRIRMVGNLYGGLSGKKGDDFNREENLSNKPFVPFTNIFNNTYISKDHFQYVNVEEGENQNRVLKNDLFFLMSSESYEDLGKSSILLDDVEELYLNSFCKGFRIKDDRVYPLFLNYQLLGSLHKEMISLEGNGFTRINLRQDRLLDIPVFIPPLEEQQQIVSFLDDKTQKIDSLIQQKEKKIKLLKEKRTSLINHVVTKGLDTNVVMKDSGVEWIGEIPNHWGCFKMKYGVNHISEKSQPNKIDIRISPENVESNTGVCFNLYSEHESEGMRFISGDVLLNKLRLYLKKILFTEYDGYSLGEMIVLRTNESLVNKYFYHILFNQGLIDLLDSQSTGVKLPRVSPDIIMNSEIIYPPLSEQQQIVEYLDEQTQLIDNTISIEEKRIELLKEYRQSAISEVVTGKRKVD